MKFEDKSLKDFVRALGSKTSVPGGGGASALVAAVGMSLGDMVACFTIGKKQYEEHESELIELKAQAESLEKDFLRLVDLDAEAFEPLARAYKAGPGEEMEQALKDACEVPLEIMRKCAESIRLHAEFADKGSKLMISDAGAGVIICKGAMQAASLNVYVNAGSIQDKAFAAEVLNETRALLDEYEKMADDIFDRVKRKL